MPKESQDIRTFLVEKLEEHWDYMENEFYQCEVNLSLPKFELKPERISMNDILSNLGIDGEMGVNILTGIETPLDVFQIATVRFDEKGAEAAAVTGSMDGAFTPQKSAVMTVDRPFLFFITEDSTGLCLFAGKVVKL